MIELPWPPKALSPNFRSRSHWLKTRALKAARLDAYYATIASDADCGGDHPIRLSIQFYPPDRRARDEDNMMSSCKAYLDGIAQAWGVNDSAFRSTPVICQPVKGGKIVVSVMPS